MLFGSLWSQLAFGTQVDLVHLEQRCQVFERAVHQVFKGLWGPKMDSVVCRPRKGVRLGFFGVYVNSACLTNPSLCVTFEVLDQTMFLSSEVNCCAVVCFN